MEDFDISYVKYKDLELTRSAPLVKDVAQRMEEIKLFKPRNGDVLLSTFPKSGTHWFFEMICMLVKRDATYIATEPEDHWMEVVDEIKSLDNFESPRVFISHLPYKYLPEAYSDVKMKIVHVVRNPRDVFVSLYHYFLSATNHDVSWEKYLENIMADKSKLFGGWFAHERGFEEAMKNNDACIHTVYYEDMCKNPLKELKILADFLEAKTDDETLRDIVMKSSFDSLKMHYESGTKSREKLKKLVQDMGVYQQCPTIFRKGKPGDWKTKFTVEQSERFTEVLMWKMKDSKLLKYL